MSKNSISMVFPENSWIPWETSDVQASFLPHDLTISNKTTFALDPFPLCNAAPTDKRFSTWDIGKDIKITYIAAPQPCIYRMLVNNFIPIEPSMRECTSFSAAFYATVKESCQEKPAVFSLTFVNEFNGRLLKTC